jgi:hypothetical protein
MRQKLQQIARNAVVAAVVFALPVFRWQSPGLARLIVTSTPPGAKITLNGNEVQRPTNATLVVGPGKYKIAVTGGPGNVNCGEKEVTVVAGKDVALSCTSSGWQ